MVCISSYTEEATHLSVVGNERVLHAMELHKGRCRAVVALPTLDVIRTNASENVDRCGDHPGNDR
jgi:hypothetical protein